MKKKILMLLAAVLLGSAGAFVQSGNGESLKGEAGINPASTERKVFTQNKEREIKGPNTEICRFEKVIVNGIQKSIEKKEITLHRKVEGAPEYQKEVSGFDYVHKRNNTIENGTPEYQRTEGHFKIIGRTDILSALKVNGFGADNITTMYTFYHEAVTYDDGEVQVSFDFMDGTFYEKSTVVETITSPVAGKDAAKLTNTITAYYFLCLQDVSESVILLKDADVSITNEGFVATRCKETVYGDSVTVHALYRITKSDGSREDFAVDFCDTRTSEIDPAWSSIESNNMQSTSSASRTETGSAGQSSSKNGFTAKWKRYTYDVKSVATLAGSKQNNRIKTVEPEGWEITYRGKTFKFNRPSYSASNDNGTVTEGGKNNGYNEYNYANKFNYTRGGNNKSFTSSGVIKVKLEEVSITDEGFVATRCKETVYGDSVTVHALYRITKSDGSREDFAVDFCDTRTSEIDPAWSSIESNNMQSTSSASRTETGSAGQSSSKNGFTAKWKRYTYDVKSVATLAGSKQNNRIKTVEPEGWEITYRGKTFKFNRPSYSASNDNGTVTEGGKNNGYNEYNYANKFNYTRGGNNKSFTSSGVIKVKLEEPTFFPKEWGNLIEAKQTVANNETHSSFVYTWSLRFENNIVLPVVVRSGDATPEWHFEYAENTTITEYNGGTYDKASDTWINTTASDKPNQMVWSRNSKEKANKDYRIAMNQNWDEGHLIDGHPSTQTSRYQLTVSNGVLKATDTYTGRYIGEWKNFTNTVEMEEVLPGDADGNGQVNLADAEAILDYITGKTSEIGNAADANGDGVVDITDVTWIIRMLTTTGQ